MNYYISKYASKHVKVVLSGLGADELFGGYNRYKAHIIMMILKNINPKVYSFSTVLLRHLNHSRNNIFSNYIRAIDKVIFSLIKEESFLSLIDYFPSIDWNILPGVFQKYPFHNLEEVMEFDFNNYMRDNLLYISDYMSMRASLEVRVPFVYKSIYFLSKNLKTSDKISLFNSKIILKKIAEKFLDKNIIYRRKQGFTASIENWLHYKGENFIMNRINDSNIILSIGLDVKKLGKYFFSDGRDYSLQIYSLYMLTEWENNIRNMLL